ncbi:hypothetical protein BKA81DRAFT_419989 [Phyllosticta paracitricarpa]
MIRSHVGSNNSRARKDPLVVDPALSPSGALRSACRSPPNASSPHLHSLSPYRQRVPLIVSRFPPFTPSKRGDRKLSRQGERERYISVHSTSRLPPSSSVHLKPPRPRHWTLSCSPPAWLWDIAPQLPSFLPSLPLGFCERSVSGPSGLYLRA